MKHLKQGLPYFLIVCIVIMGSLGITLLKDFLPNYHGLVQHEKEGRVHTLDISDNEASLIDPLQDYSVELGNFIDETDFNHRQIYEIETYLFQIIRELNPDNPPLNLESIVQSISIDDAAKSPVYYIKKYAYEDQSGNIQYLQLKIDQDQEYTRMFLHIVPEKITKINEEIISEVNDELKLYLSNGIHPHGNPFNEVDRAMTQLRDLAIACQMIAQEYAFDVFGENLNNYYSVLYENELLLFFTAEKNQMVLFFNPYTLHFSGFSFVITNVNFSISEQSD